MNSVTVKNAHNTTAIIYIRNNLEMLIYNQFDF